MREAAAAGAHAEYTQTTLTAASDYLRRRTLINDANADGNALTEMLHVRSDPRNLGQHREEYLMKRSTFIPLFLISSLVGCSTVQPIDTQSKIYTHLVRMDRDGAPLNVATGKKTGIEAFKIGQVEPITSEIGEFVKKKSNGKRSIVIYVHGAPLFREVGVSESRKKLRAMQSINPNWYPIVFNWEGLPI